MAKKKYKNVKIEQEELKPIAIGAFESRKKTSLGIFVILTLFVLAVIFLPQISEFIDEYLNPTPSTPVTPNNPTPEEPDEPDEPSENVDETFYPYTANLSIEREKITVSGITIDNTTNTISYTVTNTTNSYQNIEELNYYIEIYNADRTLLERVKLVSLSVSDGVTSNVIGGGTSQSYTRAIDSTSAITEGYIVLVQKTTDDYPEVTLTENTEGNATLVCSNAHEKVTYTFENKDLKQVTSVVEYLATEPDYTTNYSSYQTLSNSYNTTKGMTSTFIMNTTGFYITTVMNLEEASRSYLFNADSFRLDTEPKVVSFEMEAQGFDCN